jgi:hypothetical protein
MADDTLTSLSDTDVVELAVTINGVTVVDTKLYMKYAKKAISYALESVQMRRMEDARAELEANNAATLAAAAAPIDAASAQAKAVLGLS